MNFLYIYMNFLLYINFINGIYLIFVFYQGRGSNYYTVHMICEIISGFVIAGVLPWVLYLAIRKTGALDNFASSRYSVTEI